MKRKRKGVEGREGVKKNGWGMKGKEIERE
jgi:hypothetical protein